MELGENASFELPILLPSSKRQNASPVIMFEFYHKTRITRAVVNILMNRYTGVEKTALSKLPIHLPPSIR